MARLSCDNACVDVQQRASASVQCYVAPRPPCRGSQCRVSLTLLRFMTPQQSACARWRPDRGCLSIALGLHMRAHAQSPASAAQSLASAVHACRLALRRNAHAA